MAAPLAVTAAILAGLCVSATPANAVCAPDPASSGQTVTCSGDDPDGFEAGGGVNTLTVNVLPGATVSDNGTAAIGVNDSNSVTSGGTLTAGVGLTGINAVNSNTIANNGTITAGDTGIAIATFENNTVTNSGTLVAGTNGTGIFAGVNNAVTNAATGVITVGNDGNAIFVAGNSTVTNAGSITVGAAPGFFAVGILATSDDNSVVNSAGATITVGNDAVAIWMQGNRSTVSNAGTLTVADGAGIVADTGNDAKVTNTGTINVGDQGAGIAVQGDRAVITNSGTLTAGTSSAGIVFAGSSATITNSGSMIGGDFAEGIQLLGDSNTIINSGTITVGNSGIAVDVTSLGGTNHIVNTGTINVGNGGTGILLSDSGTIFNSGTINAATGLAAIEFCGCGTGNVLTLGPGSVIRGLVLGTGTDTFQLGGSGRDAFNLSLIGAGQQYDGFSTFNKVDSSNWTVIGTGAQDWNVFGGTLSVNGLIAGTVTVNAGGTLGGIGTVGNTIVNGGVLAPGNSIGTLNVAGNLSFTAASSYMVEISGASSDLVRVTGTATLGGATVVAIPSGPVMKQYTILTATGGVPDTFNPVVAGVSPNLKASLSYDANSVYLNFALGFGGGLNTNQQNVANTLTNSFNNAGGLPLPLANLSPAGLTQASGEPGTGSQQATFNAMNLFLGLLTDPFVAGRSGGPGGNAGATPFAGEDTASAYASGRSARSKNERDTYAAVYRKAPAVPYTFNQRWSVWAAGYGGSQTTDGNTVLGSNGATARVFGGAVGADYLLSPYTIAGFALAGGGTNFSVNGLGWGRSDLFQAGAFVHHAVGAAYLSAALAYGWQDVTTDRIVTAAGVDHLRAEFNANTFSGRFEGGYRYATPWIGVTPYAAAQVTTFELPNYAEGVVTGANTFALTYAAKSVTDTRTELGLRADKSYVVQGGILTLRGRAAWAHDFNPDRSIGAVFQTLPGAAFVVNGAAQAPDSALTTASVEMKWLNGWSAAGTFEGEFSNVTRSYAGKGVVRYVW